MHAARALGVGVAVRRVAVVATCAIVALGACGDDGGTQPAVTAPSTTSATTIAPTTTMAPTTTVAPTTSAPRPVVVTPAMIALVGVATKDRVASLFGTVPYTQNRVDVADVSTAFSSSPELVDLMKTQNVGGTYNAWSATAACVVCAVQIPVLTWSSEASAAAGYTKIKSVNETIFKNVKPQASLGPYWTSSFCQTGDFTTTQGQTLLWYFCALHKGNLVVTTAVGGLNFNTTTVGDALKGYANALKTYLKGQFG